MVLQLVPSNHSPSLHVLISQPAQKESHHPVGPPLEMNAYIFSMCIRKKKERERERERERE